MIITAHSMQRWGHNMNTGMFEYAMMQAAEEADRKSSPAHIALLKQSYDFFEAAGLSEKAIQATMALTSLQMRLIKRVQ